MSKAFKIAYTVAIILLVFGVVKFSTPNTFSYRKISDHVYVNGNISSQEVNQIETYISYLPTVLKSKFNDEGWSVYVTNNIEEKVVGRTVMEDKAVYIKSGFENQELMHEFFHIYLHEHPFGSDFKEIYESEAKNMMIAYYGEDSEYKYSDITEFYCSAANTVYWLHEDQFGVAPKTFEYFTELFNELYKEE